MSRKRKLNHENTNEKISYEKKLEISNEKEPLIRVIVTSMMFSAGDSLTPIKENEDLVLDILKNEIVYLLNDIIEIREEKKSDKICLSEIITILQRQKSIISHFINYLTKRITMTSYLNAKSFSPKNIDICANQFESSNIKLENNIDNLEEIEEMSGEEETYSVNKKKSLCFISDEKTLNNVKNCLKNLGYSAEDFENFDDESFQTKQNALLEKLNEMDIEDYKFYSQARQASFQRYSTINDIYLKNDKVHRKMQSNENPMSVFLDWIGNPPIKDESVEVFLGFFAKEVVHEIVGSALVEKINEKKNYFKNDQNYSSSSLQIRHYEEAIRKNSNFRNYGRIFV